MNDFTPSCLLRLHDEQYELEDYQGGVPRWCTGCGDNAILTAVQRLCRDENLAPERTVFVSGIGCSQGSELRGLRREGAQSDREGLFGENPCDGGAQAARGAGDDCDSSIHNPSFLEGALTPVPSPASGIEPRHLLRLAFRGVESSLPGSGT